MIWFRKFKFDFLCEALKKISPLIWLMLLMGTIFFLFRRQLRTVQFFGNCYHLHVYTRLSGWNSKGQFGIAFFPSVFAFFFLLGICTLGCLVYLEHLLLLTYYCFSEGAFISSLRLLRMLCRESLIFSIFNATITSFILATFSSISNFAFT